jgi:riboflavin kinase / FMN adenylyltransferase
MRVIRDLREISETPRASVITIGNFDGVHLAHQQLLKRVVESARLAGALAAAVTFEPHPARVLMPERAPTLLTSSAQKTRLVERLGIDLLVILAFTEELARVTPEDFVREILVKHLRPVSVLVGPNFRFGHRQAGNTQVLEELARQEGFRVEVLSMLTVRGERISSSRIRQLLAEGRVGIAGRLLGRPYSTNGAIVHGMGVGSKQTVPTLNLAPIEELIPREGVYITRTRLGGVRHDSVTNVGYKPTFGEHRLTVESHLLNFTGEITDGQMEVEYFYRLRDERKFPDPAALKAQIHKDARRAEHFFRLSKLLHNRFHRRLVAGELS